jgi:mannosyltransferase
MELNNKTYGFVINIYDSPQSIQSLWPTTQEYLALYPDAIHPNSAVEWVTDSTRRPAHNRAANGYSTCHFWSNFEIGDLRFWRSERYQRYFDYLDRQGGFFYERWGDAPVHSVALGLFEDKHKIHWFHDIGIPPHRRVLTIGYNHIPYFNCPASKKCRGCDAGKFFGMASIESVADKCRGNRSGT